MIYKLLGDDRDKYKILPPIHLIFKTNELPIRFFMPQNSRIKLKFIIPGF